MNYNNKLINNFNDIMKGHSKEFLLGLSIEDFFNSVKIEIEIHKGSKDSLGEKLEQQLETKKSVQKELGELRAFNRKNKTLLDDYNNNIAVALSEINNNPNLNIGDIEQAIFETDIAVREGMDRLRNLNIIIITLETAIAIL